MSVEENLHGVLRAVEERAAACRRDPKSVGVVVVSKTKSWEMMREAYRCGCRDFGENRVPELLEKRALAPDDIRWHFIGKLQKNKVAKLVGKVELIHSVDSVELAQKIGAESLKVGLVSDILLEANTSGEATKGGLTQGEWKRQFEQVLAIEGIAVKGLMTMAPLTEDAKVIRHTFASLVHLRDDLQKMAGGRASLETLSMGMSNDFLIAIEEGATLLRIGSAIFTPG